MKSEVRRSFVRLSRRGLGTGFAAGRIVALGAVLLGFAGALWWAGCRVELPHIARTSSFTQVSRPAPQSLLGSYRGLPLIFEANRGQSDPRVKFLARGSGYGLFLTRDEAVLALRKVGRRTSGVGRRESDLSRPAVTVSVVRMQLANANPNPDVSGDEPLPGHSNYLIGNDPAQWRRNVPQFARVRYRQVYAGIDLVYYGRQGQLEYDFEVAPGSDPQQVMLRFQGPEGLQLAANGDLLLINGAGEVRLQAPRVYQQVGEERRPVSGRFVLRGRNQAGFAIGDYDRTKVLIIDPVLVYSTYLGGSGDEACSLINGAPASGCPAIAVDSAGSAYVAGATTSADFPVTSGVIQGTLAGGSDVFVAKFNSAGSALVFATYLGGTGDDSSVGVAVDSGFDVFVAGTTASSDFPTDGTTAAFQPTPKVAGTHAFISELDSAGATLLYSTYLSGSGADIARGLALDVKNKAYVMGTTTSDDYPTTTGAFQTAPKPGTTNQFFMSNIDPTVAGSGGLVCSTYLGGSQPSNGTTDGGAIAVDTNTTPNVYLTGGTTFTDMPVLNAAQGSVAGGEDAFVAKFTPSNASGTQEIYLTYAGGSDGDDIGNGIAVDSGGNAYITGSTTSTNIAAVSGTTPFQADNKGGKDGFVFKLNNPAEGSSVGFTYFSYIGGTADDVGYAIAADTSQGARITGSTDSSDFPTVNAISGTGYIAGTDAFAARIDTTASAHSSSVLGGSGADLGTGIVIDSASATYLAGETASATTNFITQGALNGASDAFVAKVGPSVNLVFDPAPTATPNPDGVGNDVTFTYKIKNNGDLTTGITFTDTLPASGATFKSATSSPGTCNEPTGTPPVVTCSIGALNTGGTATVTIVLIPTLAGPLGNSGVVSVVGSSFQASGSASTVVNDFNVSVAPASATVVAGAPASYTVTVTPVPTFPNSISLSCSSGVPSGATCSFSTNPLPDAEEGPVTSALTINTTIRPIPTSMLHLGPTALYAALLPVAGLALLGVGGRKSRLRRVLGTLLVLGVLGLILFQAACGSSGTTTPQTGGTPAGTYPITVTATSGAATRTTSLTLVVQ